MSDDRVDVVVAGSGPAGSVSALVLARAGARVLLVDPGRFPRDKACGDLPLPTGLIYTVGRDWTACGFPGGLWSLSDGK